MLSNINLVKIMNNSHNAVFLKDYHPYPFSLSSLELDFQLFDDATEVSAIAHYKKKGECSDLHLKGEELELLSLLLDGREWRWKKEEGGIVVEDVPSSFTLQITTRIYPEKNKALEGLYRSGGMYCTQCEAEGFRKITFFPDRPDVLTRYTTRIEADKTSCPVLLSNGNLIKEGDCANGRHFAIWQDPFAKPSYLFALVAGELYPLEDEFITRSDRKVILKIFVEKQNIGRCDHAMVSLKKAMRWDEEVFGLEYDLDIFMIVAVDDFNMGAMENKGLNIFNSKYILTSPDSATDQDYLGVESVIAHEYFHNWTGNRVTCRDWFQLSLKEGLTVFRDQEFSSDMNSRAIQRIDDVGVLKAVQFKEDSGPMAHPVRPDNYMEINNFYTATVYNKGAEVIRMIHTLIGAENFRKGMDLYFARHDGQAVTCEDFVAAMADASGADLSQFFLWYQQAGTPKLQVSTRWDKEARRYELEVEQSCAATPGQSDKKPFHIPLKIALLDENGALAVDADGAMEKVIELRQQKQKFVFDGLAGAKKPVLSFLRGFSAPVEVKDFQSDKDLAFLAVYDSDLYNRWDSICRLAGKEILRVAALLQKNEKAEVLPAFIDMITNILAVYREEGANGDSALLARSLLLPMEMILAQQMQPIDPDALHQARELVMTAIATQCQAAFLQLYNENNSAGEYSISPEEIGKRSLKNMALRYLMSLQPLPEEMLSLCLQQYKKAQNMTESIAALGCLNNVEGDVRQQAFDDFYQKWQENPLVLDKWFRLQATSFLPDTLKRVQQLMADPAFSLTNPNKVRALIGSFSAANHYRFHHQSGDGYHFLADQVIALNGINPQIASRLFAPLVGWRRYEPLRAGLMQQQLQRIAAVEELSKDVYEVVSKSLAQE